MMQAVLVAVMLGWAAPAIAHDTWQNGDPVPAWVKGYCCGKADAKHLRPDQVHQTEHGYVVDGNNTVVPFNLALPSEDGSYWAFWREYPDGTKSTIFCLFVPMEF